MLQFMYSYPLGEKKDKESELSIFFSKNKIDLKKGPDLNRIIIRANGLNITKPFTLYAA